MRKFGIIAIIIFVLVILINSNWTVRNDFESNSSRSDDISYRLAAFPSYTLDKGLLNRHFFGSPYELYFTLINDNETYKYMHLISFEINQGLDKFDLAKMSNSKTLHEFTKMRRYYNHSKLDYKIRVLIPEVTLSYADVKFKIVVNLCTKESVCNQQKFEGILKFHRHSFHSWKLVDYIAGV
jgi:hypothetical protein